MSSTYVFEQLQLTEKQQQESETLARAVNTRYHISEQDAPYASHFYRGPNSLPAVHLDDVSAIPFTESVLGVEYYQLRTRARVEPDSYYICTIPELVEYEQYNREYLGLGVGKHIFAPPLENPTQIARAAMQQKPLARLSSIAREHNGMILHPYMGNQDVWDLGLAISKHAGSPLFVLAPPPAITAFTNNKASFSHLVKEVLGEEALVETYVANDAKKLTTHLQAMAERGLNVGLKMHNCASAMGNITFSNEKIRTLSFAELLSIVENFILSKAWSSGMDVLAVAWEDAISSPSSQCWIPPDGTGEPVVEAIYEQILESDEKIFLGSYPSQLPHSVNRDLATQSLKLAKVFQKLGYVGRCSFDAIVRRVDDASYQVRFTECNGRWGGTSTPMVLVKRALKGELPMYWAQDYIHPKLQDRNFNDILAALKPYVYDIRSGEGIFLFYNVGCQEPYGKLDVIALASKVHQEPIKELLPELLEKL